MEDLVKGGKSFLDANYEVWKKYTTRIKSAKPSQHSSLQGCCDRDFGLLCTFLKCMYSRRWKKDCENGARSKGSQLYNLFFTDTQMVINTVYTFY